jgi:hypothetical protein
MKKELSKNEKTHTFLNLYNASLTVTEKRYDSYDRNVRFC